MLITSHNVRPYHFLCGWSDYTIFQLDLLLRAYINSLAAASPYLCQKALLHPPSSVLIGL